MDSLVNHPVHQGTGGIGLLSFPRSCEMTHRSDASGQLPGRIISGMKEDQLSAGYLFYQQVIVKMRTPSCFQGVCPLGDTGEASPVIPPGQFDGVAKPVIIQR